MASASDVLRRLTSPEVNEFFAQASLFLLFGGLSVLGLIMGLVLVQRALPESVTDPPKSPQRRTVDRSLRPVVRRRGTVVRPRGGFVEGGKAAEQVRSRSIDQALRAMVLQGLGEPRLLHYERGHATLRLFHCTGCAHDVARRDGCAYERGFFENSLGRIWRRPVASLERACRARGAAVCEFEVYADDGNGGVS